MLKFLDGWKTYLLGISTITGALASYAANDIDLFKLVIIVINALFAMSIRHGITTTVSDATNKKL